MNITTILVCFFDFCQFTRLLCAMYVQRLLNTKVGMAQFVSASLPNNKFKNRLANILPCMFLNIGVSAEQVIFSLTVLCQFLSYSTVAGVKCLVASVCDPVCLSAR